MPGIAPSRRLLLGRSCCPRPSAVALLRCELNRPSCWRLRHIRWLCRRLCRRNGRLAPFLWPQAIAVGGSLSDAGLFAAAIALCAHALCSAGSVSGRRASIGPVGAFASSRYSKLANLLFACLRLPPYEPAFVRDVSSCYRAHCRTMVLHVVASAAILFYLEAGGRDWTALNAAFPPVNAAALSRAPVCSTEASSFLSLTL